MYLQAGKGCNTVRTHGRPGHGNGFRHIVQCHGSLHHPRVDVQGVFCDELAQPRRVGKMLRLEALVPSVQRVKALCTQLLIPAGSTEQKTLVLKIFQ